MKKQRKRLASIAFCALWLGVIGCGGGDGVPNWVKGGRPDSFPEETHVSAVGVGNDLAAAQLAAKAELTRIFAARIDSELELIEQESLADGVAATRSDLLSDTRISTGSDLQGVEVPLHWRDEGSGEIWVLAVLERATECSRIRAEGRDLATELDGHVRSAGDSSNPLASTRASLHAVRVGAQLDGLHARSRVLGSRCAPTPSVSTGELRQGAAESRSRLTFVVRTADIDGVTREVAGPLPQLREQIAGDLSRRGFRVGRTAGDGVVSIDARLRLSRVERGTDWVEYRYEGSVEVGLPYEGAPALISVEASGTESHPEASSARLRARRAGERELARRLDRQIEAFLERTESE